jgi:hypothetical protein
MVLPRRPARHSKPLSSLRHPTMLQHGRNREGSGTNRLERSVFGSSNTRSWPTRDSVHLTRTCPAARSTSDQCSANASPRRKPVPSMSTMRGSRRSPLAASRRRPTSYALRYRASLRLMVGRFTAPATLLEQQLCAWPADDRLVVLHELHIARGLAGPTRCQVRAQVCSSFGRRSREMTSGFSSDAILRALSKCSFWASCGTDQQTCLLL